MNRRGEYIPQFPGIEWTPPDQTMTIGGQEFWWNGNYWEPWPTPTPPPVITSLKPDWIPTNSGPQTITITGENLCGLFALDVDMDSSLMGPGFTGTDTELTFTIDAAELLIPGGNTWMVNVGSSLSSPQSDSIGVLTVGATTPLQPATAGTLYLRTHKLTEGQWNRVGFAVAGQLDPPDNVAAANAATIPGKVNGLDGVGDPLPEAMAWPTGAFITFDDASEGYWNGTQWVAGRAP